MKTNLTEIVFILDESGSMMPLTKNTIDGFNSLLKEQKQGVGDAIVTTVFFDHRYKVVHDRMPIEQINPITEKDYIPTGMTALIDAIGTTIESIQKKHVETPKSERPDKVLFVIMTDGEENASRKYSSEKVKSLITTCKELLDWEFLFLGANIDAVETASKIGISKDRSVEFHCDEIGVARNYAGINKAVHSMRKSAPLDASWKEDIEDDFKSRGENHSKKRFFHRLKK